MQQQQHGTTMKMFLQNKKKKSFAVWPRYTVELHLSGLTGTASHPDMQKILIIGFFFESRLHWQF
jgi:hypothetical protein